MQLQLQLQSQYMTAVLDYCILAQVLNSQKERRPAKVMLEFKITLSPHLYFLSVYCGLFYFS